MTYRGHVNNGQILPDQPVSLPEGALVNVEVSPLTLCEFSDPNFRRGFNLFNRSRRPATHSPMRWFAIEGDAMAIYFVDSSALVKRYRNEAGSPMVADLFNRADRIIISRLTALEVSAALVRRGRVSGVLPGDVTATLAILDRNTQNSFQFG